MTIWTQANSAPVRPSARGLPTDLEHDPGESLTYLRAYLRLRLAIGALGILLPIVLLVGDQYFLDGDTLPRGSLSAYYHSGMRDVFVSTLVATGVFLLTYKVATRTLDNLLSGLAGLAAVGVALFPTGLPSNVDNDRLTPLQDALSEGTVSLIHAVSATVFITLLGVMAYLFGRREGVRSPRAGHRSPTFWKLYHWACCALIAAAGAFILVTKSTHTLDQYSLLIGETVAGVAFGASWFAKGLELDYLRVPRADDQRHST